MKKLIIFDMDGTLIDSGDVITNTINFVRVKIGLNKIEKDVLLTQLNNPNINSAEYFYGSSEFTDEQTKLFGEYYDANCTKDIKLYAGIKDLLELLQKDYILSVATNAYTQFAIKMLKALDIYQYFSFVIGSNDVPNPKPKPDMLLYTLKKLNYNKDEAILIGDSEKDKLSAKNIDMDFILVNWGFSNHKNGILDIDELKKKIKDI
jgi:phosphoglycolate phosphatase